MKLKCFTFVAAAVLTVSTVCAQTSRAQEKSVFTPAQLAQIKAVQHLPNRPAVNAKVSAGESGSYNWGGYAVTGTDFTNVKGSWVVPTVNCALSADAAVAFWVGLDGWNSGSVEQTGVGVICSEQTPIYYAWYEFYPNPSYVITNIAVHPGDTFSAEVGYSSSTQEFTTTITDVTTGHTYSTSSAAPDAARSSAEWIIEAPAAATGILNLGAFGQADFGNDYTSGASNNEATDSTTSGVIKKFGANGQRILQVDWLLYKEQTAAPLAADGSSFYNTFIQPQ